MVWLDGRLHETSYVSFDLADRGLLLGDGVFDTSLVLGGRMVWRDAHVGRLVSSCQALGFTIDTGQIEAAIDAVLPAAANASLRVTVTRGAGPRGVAPPKTPKPTVFAATAPLRTAALFAPIKLRITEIRRNETSPASRLKSLAYVDAVLAARDALAAGCDDALFVNTRDHIACTAIGNVFLLIGDQLVTPPIHDGIVAGIARGHILATCAEVGLEPVERSLTRDDLKGARAVLVTNSLRLIAPVLGVGRQELHSSGSRRVQALIAHLAELIRNETGVDPRRVAGR